MHKRKYGALYTTYLKFLNEENFDISLLHSYLKLDIPDIDVKAKIIRINFSNNFKIEHDIISNNTLDINLSLIQNNISLDIENFKIYKTSDFCFFVEEIAKADLSDMLFMSQDSMQNISLENFQLESSNEHSKLKKEKRRQQKLKFKQEIYKSETPNTNKKSAENPDQKAKNDNKFKEDGISSSFGNNKVTGNKHTGQPNTKPENKPTHRFTFNGTFNLF